MMRRQNSKLIQRLNQVPGQVYLLIAVILFATANSIIRKLTQIGQASQIDDRNPISFCNVLFVGNLCALLVFILIYHRQITAPVLRQLSPKNWGGLIAVAILSGSLAPALIFAALDITAVNNVILIGRIETPLTLVIAVVLLRAPVNIWITVGALFSFIGVVLTVLLQSPTETVVQMMGVQIGRGELMVAAGAIAAALASVMSQVTLQQVPLGLFNIIRTAIGTLVFFTAALLLFGTEHFADVFSPLLWKWMAFYGAIIVGGGQLCWFAGLKVSRASEVSLANSLNPIAGILSAYLILGETPTIAQYLGGAVIFIGIVFNQIGIVQQAKQPPATSTPIAIEQEMEVGFRGI